jgi:hypothetical protein
MTNSTDFPLQEVINDLLNSEVSLTSPLMKLNYFARLTKNKELQDFTSSEINGYKCDIEEIPNYRKTRGSLVVDIQAYRNRHTGEIPISMIDERIRSALKYIDAREGIATIEKMNDEMSERPDNNQIERSLPIEMLPLIQPAVVKLYKSDVRISAVGAKIIGNGNFILEIPNAIRTKLMDFAMEIVDDFGYEISIETYNKNQEKNNQTIIHQMNTTINNNGDGNVINTGSKNKIVNQNEFYKNNLDALKERLEEKGVDNEDIETITAIVQEEEPNKDKNQLGDKANNWILGVIGKSLKGVGKIATDISANLLSTFVKQYYDIE